MLEPTSGFTEVHWSSKREPAKLDTLSEPDAIMVAVPIPLTTQRDPDMRYVVGTAEAIAARLRPGQLVILESTTYPGTTDELVRDILKDRGSVVVKTTSSHLRKSPGQGLVRAGGIRHSVANTTRLPEGFGSFAPTQLEEGIRKCAEFCE